MAKKIPGATQSAATQRIQRTEAYAGKVKKMFDETVNDILKLKLAKPTEEGVMYSFDGDSLQVRKQVEYYLKRLHAFATLAVKKGIQAEWGIANREMDNLVKATFGKKLFESDRFRAWTAHNEDAMNAFVNRTDKGMNLSDRVWKASRQLRDEMEVALTVGMGSGESAASMSRAVRQCLNDPDLMFRRFRYKKGEDADGNPVYGKKWKKKVIEDGKTKWIDYDKDSYIPKGAGGHSRGVYRSAAKNAMRVARTETNMAYRRADYERWQKMDFVLGIRIEMSNQHPRPDICDEMQGDYPKTFYFSGFHPHCYSDDTMVLTDEGWKLFSDVRGDELILSLNPETRESEWTTITDRQCWRNDGAMRHFRNKSLDCLVTPEHRMVYLNKSDGRIEYTTADDYRKGKGAFYRGCLNTNPDRDTIAVCGKVVNFDWFCEFMGYYLSDGSTVRKSQIIIAQKDGETSKATVRQCLEKAGYRVTSRQYTLEFYDTELCTYLKLFGLYYEKYVPSEILNASQRQIRIFLDAFSICDGYRRKPKPFTGSHGHAFCSDREEVMYYTTSQRMAGNLSELILKVGGRPSFSIQQPQTTVKKDGSQIVGKYPCYQIRECKSVTATVFTDETVEYHGNVYDLTLEKNHIMYVARNGKCFWGSNCFCYATPILVSEDEMAKVTEEFMEGRTYVPKGEPILDTPPAFKQWVADNSDRIRNASSLPYWIKDNPQFVDARKGVALTPDPERLRMQIEKKGITLTPEETRDQKIAEAAKKRHDARPEGYREALLAKRQLTQDIDALLGKAEDFGWNANISSLKDALHDMRFSKDAAITTEKLQKEYDALKESINKQKKILSTTAANLEKLANKYGYSQDIKDLADAMSDTQTYTELHQKQRELAKAISAEIKDNRMLSEIIPDVEKWKGQFTSKELHQVKDAVQKTLDTWVAKYNYGSWEKAPLIHKKAKLESEMQYLAISKKDSTWEVAQSAYAKALTKVEHELKVNYLNIDLAALKTPLTSKFKALGDDINDIEKLIQQGKLTEAEAKIAAAKQTKAAIDKYDSLSSYYSPAFYKLMTNAKAYIENGDIANAMSELAKAEKLKIKNETAKATKAANAGKPAQTKTTKAATTKAANNDTNALPIGNTATQSGHLQTGMSTKEKTETTKRLCGVTDAIARELNDAVSSFSYQWDYEIRQIQCGNSVRSRHGHTMAEIRKKADDLEKFIDLSPKWQGGETYRGMSLSQKDFNNLIKQLKKGDGNMMGSASWTTQSSISESFSGSHIGETSKQFGDLIDKRVVLVSKTQNKATSIMHLSDYPTECEVLASKDCRYKYLRHYDKNGITFIEIEPSN